MRRKILWALVGVNAVLAVMCLSYLFQAQSATAQAQRPSEYIMVPGKIPGVARALFMWWI